MTYAVYLTAHNGARREQTEPSTSLTAATTGTGTVVDLGMARASVACVLSTTGTATTGAVALDLSQDGTTWVLGTGDRQVTLTSDSVQELTASGGAWRYARLRVASDVTGGATVTGTVMGV